MRCPIFIIMALTVAASQYRHLRRETGALITYATGQSIVQRTVAHFATII